ncbi:MAG TPA: class I SAM-dependent RNA methyltransferase [Clostridiales bacterium]|nr:class I SAM-dependent RNA methyltransferase [Clostridiales bacterium]
MTYCGKIESLDFFGNGILHKDGKCCFIKNALPFEEIMYTLTEDKKSYARGETVEILSPSLQRVKPPCPYYGDCGGCHFQHIDYRGEVAAKEQHVARVLAKIGGCADLELLPFVPAQRVFAYRNQVTFHMQGGQTCFYRQATHDYVTVNRCELLEDDLNKAVAEINAAGLMEATSVSLRRDNTGHVFAVVNGGSAAKAKELLSFSRVITGVAAVSEKGTAVYGDGTLFFDLDGIKLKTSYKSFFQVNTEMAKTMLRYGKDLFKGDKKGVLLDLYCGVGSIGLYLADCFQKVYGIEIVKDAAVLAGENAAANGIEAEYISGKTENRLKDLLKKVPRADVVLLDPPRQGLQKDVAKTVAAYGAQNILYISCDPASLSRDLQELTKSYKVVSAKPFDLFPRTAHVETCVLLSHKNS